MSHTRDKQLLEGSRWLRETQANLGLTNPEMAELIGCSVSHLENMRSARRLVMPRTRKIVELTTFSIHP